MQETRRQIHRQVSWRAATATAGYARSLVSLAGLWDFT